MAISLDTIAKTKHASPPIILLHGTPKVGKSTFFAGGIVNGLKHIGAPNPIFIRTEDGLNGIDTNAFPLANNYQDVVDALIVLSNEKHEYKTVIIDSADWLERLIHEKVCKDDNVKNIELAAGGYGKGYSISLNYWREIMRRLEFLNKKLNMIVGIICHSVVIEFNDPLTEPFSRYEIKLHQNKRGKGSRDLLFEAADIIGFAQRKYYVNQRSDADGNKIARGVNSEESNKLNLVESPAFIAGNRYSLPAEMNLDWSEFQTAMTNINKPVKLKSA